MDLQFLGGTGTVTGSKFLVTVPRRRVLVDCGLFQGYKQLRMRNRARLAVDPGSVDAVCLTHAHLDHTGYLPLFIKNGFRGHAYCTPATRELLSILLPDAGWLNEEEADYANRKGYSKHSPALPLYTRHDAIESLVHLKPVKYGHAEPVGGKLDVTWLPAGHILGAAMVKMEHAGTSLLFSGDLGRPHDPLMRAPEPPPEADHVVVESTYGDRRHPSTNAADELGEIVTETAERGGITLIPAFAVGRAQLLLTLLHRLKEQGRIPQLPIHVNSPMASDVTRLHARHLKNHRLDADEARRIFSRVECVSTVEDSKALVKSKVPAIIISASGMATGGRVLHHLKALLGDSRHSIVFAGYQAGGTRGRRLVDGHHSVRIFGRTVEVKARIHSLDGLSAHADREEILDWLSGLPRAPKRVYVVHGEPESSDALRFAIEQRFGWNVTVPEQGDRYELDGPGAAQPSARREG
jgi:metallo-beta-lactamase family protein